MHRAVRRAPAPLRHPTEPTRTRTPHPRCFTWNTRPVPAAPRRNEAPGTRGPGIRQDLRLHTSPAPPLETADPPDASAVFARRLPWWPTAPGLEEDVAAEPTIGRFRHGARARPSVLRPTACGKQTTLHRTDARGLAPDDGGRAEGGAVGFNPFCTLRLRNPRLDAFGPPSPDSGDRPATHPESAPPGRASRGAPAEASPVLRPRA